MSARGGHAVSPARVHPGEEVRTAGEGQRTRPGGWNKFPRLRRLSGDGRDPGGPVLDGLRAGPGLLRKGASGARSENRAPFRAVEARDDVRAVGRVRGRGRLRRLSPGRPWPRVGRATCDQRELARRAQVRVVAVGEDGKALPPAERGRVGIRRAGGSTTRYSWGDDIGPNWANFELTSRRSIGRCRSGCSGRTRSGCTTCTATFRSGWRTAGTTPTTARLRTARPGLPAIAVCAFRVAVTGMVPLCSSAPHTGTGAARGSAIQTWVPRGADASRVVVPRASYSSGLKVASRGGSPRSVPSRPRAIGPRSPTRNCMSSGWSTTRAWACRRRRRTPTTA